MVLNVSVFNISVWWHLLVRIICIQTVIDIHTTLYRSLSSFLCYGAPAIITSRIHQIKVTVLWLMWTNLLHSLAHWHHISIKSSAIIIVCDNTTLPFVLVSVPIYSIYSVWRDIFNHIDCLENMWTISKIRASMRGTIYFKKGWNPT